MPKSVFYFWMNWITTQVPTHQPGGAVSSSLLSRSTLVLPGSFEAQRFGKSFFSRLVTSSAPDERRWGFDPNLMKALWHFGRSLAGLLRGSTMILEELPYLSEKIVWYSLSMSSTIWLWNTIWIVILADSVWGRSNVGPNTMATLWKDILLDSLCSITLERKRKSGSHQTRARLLKEWVNMFLWWTHFSRCLNSSSMVSWFGRGRERTKSFM